MLVHIVHPKQWHTDTLSRWHVSHSCISYWNKNDGGQDLNPGPPTATKYMPDTLTTELPGLGSNWHQVHFIFWCIDHDRLHKHAPRSEVCRSHQFFFFFQNWTHAVIVTDRLRCRSTRSDQLDQSYAQGWAKRLLARGVERRWEMKRST
jgi:hypothetical protein